MFARVPCSTRLTAASPGLKIQFELEQERMKKKMCCRLLLICVQYFFYGVEMCAAVCVIALVSYLRGGSGDAEQTAAPEKILKSNFQNHTK